jgi:hypothetical protein
MISLVTVSYVTFYLAKKNSIQIKWLVKWNDVGLIGTGGKEPFNLRLVV